MIGHHPSSSQKYLVSTLYRATTARSPQLIFSALASLSWPLFPALFSIPPVCSSRLVHRFRQPSSNPFRFPVAVAPIIMSSNESFQKMAPPPRFVRYDKNTKNITRPVHLFKCFPISFLALNYYGIQTFSDFKGYRTIF
jgi:hypothetical protein